MARNVLLVVQDTDYTGGRNANNVDADGDGTIDNDAALENSLETTEMVKNQILQQASTAMLAQANASKQNVLGLLQNKI